MKTKKLKNGRNILEPGDKIDGEELLVEVVVWIKDGKYHREDGPAIEWPSGNKEWYLDGKCHREDGPAVEYLGLRQWFINGKCHREDGPAEVIGDGTNCWYLNGKRHRKDGPAIENANGTKEWYLNGIKHTEEEFNLANTQPALVVPVILPVERIKVIRKMATSDVVSDKKLKS